MRKAVHHILAQLLTLMFLAGCTSNTVPQAAQTTPIVHTTSTVIILPTTSATSVAKQRQQQLTFEKDTNIKIWHKANIRHYQFTLVTGRCNTITAYSSYLIEHKDNTSTILKASSKLSSDERICIQTYESIDKLYQEIDDFIRSTPFRINIHYDATYAYPTNIDVKLHPPPAEFDEYTIHIKDFKVLP